MEFWLKAIRDWKVADGWLKAVPWLTEIPRNRKVNLQRKCMSWFVATNAACIEHFTCTNFHKFRVNHKKWQKFYVYPTKRIKKWYNSEDKCNTMSFISKLPVLSHMYPCTKCISTKSSTTLSYHRSHIQCHSNMGHLRTKGHCYNAPVREHLT